MDEEIYNLTAMGTYDVASLPTGRSPIPCKWVFKRKLNADGSIERYRARLVLKGFLQRFGVDYNAVFAPVVRASTVRLFFSLVASLDLDCHAIDIKNAFVQSDLPEEVYMCQPPGYDDGTGSVLRVHKSLYGLKQAPRLWNRHLTEFLQELGFVQCACDGAVLLLRSPEHDLVIVLLYVDDIQIASSSQTSVQYVKKCLLGRYPGRDLGETSYFLQMSVERDRAQRVLVLRQQRHIDQLVDDLGYSDAHPKALPMISGMYKQEAVGSVITKPEAITQYKSILGVLMHIANHTRPDIAFSVNYLARFVTAPTTSHVARMVDVVKYLKGTASYGLYLGCAVETCPLYAFVDSDFAACLTSRRSTTGFVVLCGLGSIAWKSVRQPTVSRSTAESEYIAAGEVAKELQYLHQLACQFGLNPGCIPVGTDNSAALRLIDDPISMARTKHIDVIHHHVRERVKLGQMRFVAVPGSENVADMFTKPLPRPAFEAFRSLLGVHP